MVNLRGVELGSLPNYLFFFADGSVKANWQGASKGFVGDVAVHGEVANETSSGFVPYAGTIYTDDTNLGGWQQIVDDNAGQAFAVFNQDALIDSLQLDLVSAIQQINLLPVTPGFESVSSTSLNGLDTTNGVNELIVINVTSGFTVSSKININGDPGDVFVLRWDSDANFTDGYEGEVKFQSGGAIVPGPNLTPTNFINVAGDINSSGGGTTPPPPYPQGPRLDDGQGALIPGASDFSGGGFFTGYWLTTGAPEMLYTGPGADPLNPIYYGKTSSLSNGIFVGGWYTLTTEFSMTSGTSGVYVSPNPPTIEQAEPAIDIEKLVSVDGGATFEDADVPPGPIWVQSLTNVVFRYIVTNTGNETLIDVNASDDVYGPIITNTTLQPGETIITEINVPGQLGAQQNTATVTGTGQDSGTPVSDSDVANYVGVAETISLDLVKEVSPDGGLTWFDANTPPGPNVNFPQNPQFRYTVTNTGQEDLRDVTITDNVLGLIVVIGLLPAGATDQHIRTGTWAPGEQSNVATATGIGVISGILVRDTDPSFWFGFLPEPSIDIEKLVSVDGVTFVDADLPPGPTWLQGQPPNVQFQYVITNTGNETLENVDVVDDVYGPIISNEVLDPGETITTTISVPGQLGAQQNTATVTGTGVISGTTVNDSDAANYVGEALAISIDLVKEVSPDGGLTWFDANNPPGPDVVFPQNPRFRYTVTNTGQEDLRDVTISDSILGTVAVIGLLPAGGSDQHFMDGTWALGQQSNLGSVQGTGVISGSVVTDEDPANWVGVEQQPNPSLTIEKFVSVDNGQTFLPADTPPGPLLPPGVTPQFLIVVTNNGNVPIQNIAVTDSEFGPIGTIPILLPTQSAQFPIMP